MKRMLRLSSIFLVLWVGVICTPFSPYLSAQGIGVDTMEPLPPPVNIEFIAEDIPQLGEEVTLKLKVTPLEDMHAEISCILPSGIKLVREKGLMVRPYRGRFYPNEQYHRLHKEVIVLYTGHLAANTPEEFLFRITIQNKGNYKLIASIYALAKWGTKEETLVIDIK